jgi:O-methyltransferase
MMTRPGRPRLVRIHAFDPGGGCCFKTQLPGGLGPGDSAAEPNISNLQLLENGIGLGPAHAIHDVIRDRGHGLFSHWHNALYFSTSDNTDPRDNGRDYHAFAACLSPPAVQHAINVLSTLSDDFGPSEAYTAIERCLALLHPEAKIGEELKSFWRDSELIATYRKFCGENFRSLERKYTIFNLVGALAHVDGDIVECGVYNGATAYFMALACNKPGRQRKIALFDSFEGLSCPTHLDGQYWRAGALACPEELTRTNLGDIPGIDFFSGWIPTRFGEVADRSFCFVHIDVDLYEPTRDSLEFFFPRLVSRGMLVCDDYGFDSCPGARRAMDEFFADKPDKIIHLPPGQGLVIKS